MVCDVTAEKSACPPSARVLPLPFGGLGAAGPLLVPWGAGPKTALRGLSPWDGPCWPVLACGDLARASR